jgi:hypothetical protein
MKSITWCKKAGRHFTLQCVFLQRETVTLKPWPTILVHPIPEYVELYWDPYRKGQTNVLDWVRNKAAKFVHQRNDSNLEILAWRRKLARTCALFKRYMGGERKAISGRLLEPCYLNRIDHDRKIRSRKQRTKQTPWPLVRERTIPTERPPLVDEI